MKRTLTILILTTTGLAQTPAATDAIDALRAMQSVTDVGVNYQQYSARVLDAKVKVDRYLAHAKPGQTRTKVETAMQAYVIAMKAWGGLIAKDKSVAEAAGEMTRTNKELASCRLVANQIESAQTMSDDSQSNQFPLDRDVVLGANLGADPAILWGCAKAELEAIPTK